MTNSFFFRIFAPMKQIVIVISLLVSVCAMAQTKGTERPQVRFVVDGVTLHEPSSEDTFFEAGVHNYSMRHERWGKHAVVLVKEVESTDDHSTIWRFLLTGFRGAVQLETVMGTTEKPLQHLKQKASDVAYVLYDGKTCQTLEAEKGEGLFADYEQAMRALTSSFSFQTPDAFINALGGVVALSEQKNTDEMDVKNVSVCLPQPILNHQQHTLRNNQQREWKKWLETSHLSLLTSHPSPLTSHLSQLWPALKKYLAWEKRNFDADGDHLYDAYYCWSYGQDTLCYQGGAVTYSSAINYQLNRWAAQLAPLMGESAKPYQQEAEAILKAMNSRLWMQHQGHWAERQDVRGLQRLHEYAALWTVAETIDGEICTPKQAYQTTQYLDGELSQMLAGGREPQKALRAALAYFKAGRQEKGYNLLQRYIRQNKDQHLLSRVLLEGLFGIQPRALQGKLRLQPNFPESWDSASVHTPYMDVRFHRQGDRLAFDVTQHFEKPLQVVLLLPIGQGQFHEVRGSSELHQVIRLKAPVRLPEVHWMDAYVESSKMQPDTTIVQGKPKMVNLRKLMNGQDIIYASLSENYPDSVTIPLSAYASKALLLMDGTTNVMETRIANGEVVAHYKDGTQDTLSLVNPTNWHPDGTPKLLYLPLDRQKKLQAITLRALSNDVLIGLKAITLQ